MSNKFSLEQLAQAIDAQLIGDAQDVVIKRCGLLETADEHTLVFIHQKKLLKQLNHTRSCAVIINSNLLDEAKHSAFTGVMLSVKNARLAFAKLSHLFDFRHQHHRGIHASAQIDPSAKIDDTAYIGPFCVIGANVIIGAHCHIGAHCILEHDIELGQHNYLFHRVSILANTKIGNHNRIGSGTIIGSDGFGNERDQDGHWHTIYHTAGVRLDDNIEIGANVTIDKGVFTDTHIKSGVRIDNLIQIAHNVVIGEDSAICSCSGISGSTVIGKRCLLGGMVGVIDHITIADDVTILPQTGIYKNLTEKGQYINRMPTLKMAKWRKMYKWFKRLEKTLDQGSS